MRTALSAPPQKTMAARGACGGHCVSAGGTIHAVVRSRSEGIDGDLAEHRRSWWLLACTEAPPVPCKRVLPSLLALPGRALPASAYAREATCQTNTLCRAHALQAARLHGSRLPHGLGSMHRSCNCSTSSFTVGHMPTDSRCSSHSCPARSWETPARLLQGSGRMTDEPCRLPDCMGRTH